MLFLRVFKGAFEHPLRIALAGIEENRQSCYMILHANIKLYPSQDSLYIIQIFCKIDSFLPLFRGQPFFNHRIQKCFQIIVVTVQVIKIAGSIQMFQRHLRHYQNLQYLFCQMRRNRIIYVSSICIFYIMCVSSIFIATVLCLYSKSSVVMVNNFFLFKNAENLFKA